MAGIILNSLNCNQSDNTWTYVFFWFYFVLLLIESSNYDILQYFKDLRLRVHQ